MRYFAPMKSSVFLLEFTFSCFLIQESIEDPWFNPLTPDMAFPLFLEHCDPDPEKWYRMEAFHSSKTLEVPTKYVHLEGTELKQHDEDLVLYNQLFRFEKNWDGNYVIINRASAMVVEARWEFAGSSFNYIYQARRTDRDNQLWMLIEDFSSDGVSLCVIKNKRTGRVFDMYGGKKGSGWRLIDHAMHNSVSSRPNQQWTLKVFNESTDCQPTESEGYLLQMKGWELNSKVAQIPPGKVTKPYAQLQLWERRNELMNQVFRFERIGEGFYRISNFEREMVLVGYADHVPFPSADMIVQYPIRSTLDERFEWILEGAEGYCVIRNRLTRKVMSVARDLEKDGVGLVEEAFAQRNSQRWKLVKVPNLGKSAVAKISVTVVLIVLLVAGAVVVWVLKIQNAGKRKLISI